MKLLTADQSEAFNRHLAAVCQRFSSVIDSPLLARQLNSYVQNGGKRIRPSLVIWTYANAVSDGESIPTPVLDVAVAWELFHAFLLVHDDIIDGSDQRRDQPSLHRQLQSLDSNSPRFGSNLGIVVGDLYYAWVNRLLSDLDVPADTYRQMHRLFAQIAATTGLGQVVDVMQSHSPLDRRDEATLLLEYQWKTAAYTFEGPMLSAAILADLPPATHAAISRFALALGQAYQMQNDLLDLIRPVAEGSDLVEGKHTFTLLKAREFLDQPSRETFDRDINEIVASNGRAIVLAESVRQRLLGTPAVRCTSERIEALLTSSLTDADVLPPALRAAMAGCVKTLRATYFAPSS